MMRRLANWQELLAAAIVRGQGSRFRYGKRDCCLAASGLIAAMTGVNPAASWKRYGSKAEAESLIEEHGGVTGIARKALADHGVAEIAPHLAQRGDPCVLDLDGRQTAGVVDLSGRSVLTPSSDIGWTRTPVADIVAAWRLEA